MNNRPSPFPRLDHISRARALLMEELKKNSKSKHIVAEQDLSYISSSSSLMEDSIRAYFVFRDRMRRTITIWFLKEEDGTPKFVIKPAITDEDRQIEINATV